jgi:protein-S-isoprenylcysteine O-methyltransferase Ste14
MPLRVAFALIGEAVVFGVLLFGAAGTVAWLEAWAFLGIFFGMATAITLTLAREDPALLAERMGSPFQRDQPLWDKVFLVVIFPLFIGWLVLCALDSERYHWSHLPWEVEALGAAGVAFAMWAVGRVFRVNTFLAPVVKIQEERKQIVIQSGPYSVVRHPMYASVLWLFLGTPLMLGSIYGLVGSLLLVVGLVVRTALEDRELQQNLPGYRAYTHRVRFRLVPFVW